MNVILIVCDTWRRDHLGVMATIGFTRPTWIDWLVAAQYSKISTAPRFPPSPVGGI